MSTIQNEIDRIKESVADAYEAVESMGGDVPSPDLQKIDTLADSISTIKGGSGSGGNENILLNWDFRNPVNRNSSTTYSLTTTRCTVDSWYSETGCAVNVVDGGVTFDPKNDATCVFGQNLKEWELMKGKTVTFSALVSNVTAAGLSLWMYGAEGPIALPAIEVGNDVTLYSVTGIVDSGASSFRCGIQAKNSTATIKIIAAKLEYGSKQTLAKQNSDNVWEILDPPNYDLQYILCSQYDPITDVRVGSKHSNLNFIQNWYFPKPVNRNGKTSGFAQNEIVIDRWSNFSANGDVLVTSSGLELSSWMDGSIKHRSHISHVLIEGVFEFLVNKQVTLSFLTASGELGVVTEVVSPTDTMERFKASTNKLQAEIYRWNEYMNGRFCLFIFGSDAVLNSGDYTEDNPLTDTIIAAKLELGPVQTLAHKEGDTWVLNDDPDYDRQYLLCSQYDPDKPIPTRITHYYSNPNLLDNWYFADPINQRGQTEYTSGGYGIDRWRCDPANTMLIENDCIKLTGPSGSNLYQIIDNSKKLVGKTITVSILAEGSFKLILGVNNTYPAQKSNVGGLNCVSITYTLPTSLEVIYMFLQKSNTEPVKYYAAKLELGPVQTLAHKEGDTWVLNDPPPDKQQELAKCQRYQIVYNIKGLYSAIPAVGTIASAESASRVLISLPTTMRPINPTVSLVGDGSLYLSSVDDHHKIKQIAWTGLVTNGLRMAVDLETWPSVSKSVSHIDLREGTNMKLIIDANL